MSRTSKFLQLPNCSMRNASHWLWEEVIVENTFYLYKKMIHVMSLFKSPTATTVSLGLKNYYGNGFTDYEQKTMMAAPQFLYIYNEIFSLGSPIKHRHKYCVK